MENESIIRKKKLTRVGNLKIKDPLHVPEKQFKIETISENLIKESLSEDDNHFDQNPIYDKTLNTLRKFNDYRLKIALKQIESEKKLSKLLDDKIKDNLEELAATEFELKLQRNELQKQLEKATEELESSEKFSTLGEMTSKFSHDVRGPLSVIKNQVDILKIKFLNQDDEKTSTAFLRIYKSLSGINHMVEQVLEYVRGRPLHIESVVIEDIVRSCIKDIDVPDKIKLELPTTNTTLNCDKIQIQSVFYNLILNAIEAIDDEGKISIRLQENENNVMIHFQDSGPGIPQEMLEKIFEPLVTTKKKGTGLGLASCFRVVLQHEGKLTVQNNPTTFTVQLPKSS